MVAVNLRNFSINCENCDYNFDVTCCFKRNNFIQLSFEVWNHICSQVMLGLCWNSSVV